MLVRVLIRCIIQVKSAILLFVSVFRVVAVTRLGLGSIIFVNDRNKNYCPTAGNFFMNGVTWLSFKGWWPGNNKKDWSDLKVCVVSQLGIFYVNVLCVNFAQGITRLCLFIFAFEPNSVNKYVFYKLNQRILLHLIMKLLPNHMSYNCFLYIWYD